MGDYVQGKPFLGKGTGWWRHDVYIPTNKIEHLFVAGPNDDTPIYKHWEPGKYDENCSCCWLGYSHSEALHTQETKGE